MRRREPIHYESITPMTARDLVSLAGYSFSLHEVRKWSSAERKSASDWAYTTYLKEQGLNVEIPEKPKFLDLN